MSTFACRGVGWQTDCWLSLLPLLLGSAHPGIGTRLQTMEFHTSVNIFFFDFSPLSQMSKTDIADDTFRWRRKTGSRWCDWKRTRRRQRKMMMMTNNLIHVGKEKWRLTDISRICRHFDNVRHCDHISIHILVDCVQSSAQLTQGTCDEHSGLGRGGIGNRTETGKGVDLQGWRGIVRRRKKERDLQAEGNNCDGRRRLPGPSSAR